MDLNLFGSDDDAQSSSFSANLKMETYNSVVVTFNSIVANAKDAKDAKDGQVKPKDNDKPQDNPQEKTPDKKKEGPQNVHVLTQKMIVANSASNYVVDLDEEQRKTQSTSCDYLVYVPTSLNVTKETVDAFYETNFQFKKMFGKLNMKDAAATVFMQWDLFQKFMTFANQKSRKRALQWIQQSFQDANADQEKIKTEMTKVFNLTNLSTTPRSETTTSLFQRFAILYTTPVSTNIPISQVGGNNYLVYLPLADQFIAINVFGTPTDATHKFRSIISQKALTYYCNYFRWLYAKSVGLFGRITNYVPPMNSRMVSALATQVNPEMPSYNLENIDYFLQTIVIKTGLPNRNVLRNDNKLKVIQEKTRLYTFKSTPDYNLNYEKLLERLYYKYPCNLTPNAKVTAEEKKSITDAALNKTPFQTCMNDAIGASTTTKSHSIICAVAIATREFIYHNTKNTGGATAYAILTHLFTNIDFGGATNAVLKPQIQAHLNAYPTIGNQLRPLIGAACAAGDAVYAAAKLAITNFVKDNPGGQKNEALIVIKNAMDSVIDNFDNFAAFAYDNDTLLSLLKYSDKAQAVDSASATTPANINAANLMEKADYLKKLYKKGATTTTKEEKSNPSEAQQQKDEFDTVHDDELYVICGPVYFDYTWIFKQNPELIKHILGEMSEKDLKELKDGWTQVEDPLTENKYHINPNPEERSYPKMRFDNPTKMPAETSKTNTIGTGTYTYSWKEQYVSPSQANDEKQLGYITKKTGDAQKFVIRVRAYDNANGNAYTGAAEYDVQQTRTNAYITTATPPLNSIYNWTTPGYYQYECTQTITRRTGGRKWENKYVQLMRPPTYENGVQDYTEPNLPTSYPPPLMSIVPPFRGPANTFVIHAWIPGETFIAEDGTLNQRGCMDYMYKMMQLIFKTAEKNASDIASKKRICIKIAAIGYESQDVKSLRKVNRPEDKQFIGDAFFSALRDYNMLYESIIHVTLYYDVKTQSGVKTRYDEYVGQRLSVLRKSNPLAMDTSLNLKIANMDDFFTLKWYPDTDQLSKNDLLYFVDYCSSPRAFIGNMGEWPENIEDVMDDAIKVPGAANQPLLECLHNAFHRAFDPNNARNNLYAQREIIQKMTDIVQNITEWNTLNANDQVNGPTGFNTIINNLNNLCADSGNDVPNQVGSSSPTNLMVSWWKMQKTTGSNTGVMTLPRNAYISSFDEHVMILHNLLSNSKGAAAGWAGNPHFDNPDNVNASANLRNTSVNYGPYIASEFNSGTNNTFENAVYAYTQAKKILTLLSKMKYDDIQITKANQERISAALAALNAYNVGNAKMSWSMDAKFTAAVAEGAFIPNSSALHNPFMCPALLDPKEWQLVDFEDIGVREIAGAKPMSTLLKPFIDAKIRGSLASSSSSLTRSNALVISKQPNMSLLGANFAMILENMFHRNAQIQYDGKSMVFNNYAWNSEFFYKKRNDRAVLQQLTNERRLPDFASLMGIRVPSGRCINFPLFVVQLTMYLYQGNLADMTGMDMARLSCALDGTMFKTNSQIIWDQMMNGLKTHSQNFTVQQLLARLGRPIMSEDYGYVARHNDASATTLNDHVDAATNPTLKTTNIVTLKEIKRQIGINSPAALYVTNPNNLDTLITDATNYNNAVLVAVNGQTASLGWNAARQSESTVLYINKIAKRNASSVNIASELLSLKPGDKMVLTDNTDAIIKTRQVWLVTDAPKPNDAYPTMINVPVTYRTTGLFNVVSGIKNRLDNNIDDGHFVTLTLERFASEE